MSDSSNPKTPEPVAIGLFSALRHTLPKMAGSDLEGFQGAAMDLYAKCFQTVRRESVPQSNLGNVTVDIG
jgi:hypothetical protein